MASSCILSLLLRIEMKQRIKKIVRALKAAYTSKEYRKRKEYFDLKHLGTGPWEALQTMTRWNMNRQGVMRRFLKQQECKDKGIPFDPDYDLCDAQRAYKATQIPYSRKGNYKLTAEQEHEYAGLLAKRKASFKEIFQQVQGLRVIDSKPNGDIEIGITPHNSAHDMNVTWTEKYATAPMKDRWPLTDADKKALSELGISKELLDGSANPAPRSELSTRWEGQLRRWQARCAVRFIEAADKLMQAEVVRMSANAIRVTPAPSEEQVFEVFVEAMKRARTNMMIPGTKDIEVVEVDGIRIQVGDVICDETKFLKESTLAYIKGQIQSAVVNGDGTITIDLMPLIINTNPQGATQ